MTATLPDPPTRSKRRRLLRWCAEGAIALGIFVALGQWQTRTLLTNGAVAPDFVGRTLDGTEVRLSDHVGERIFLHFWATWCGVCRQEFGMLNRLQQELPPGTRIIAVSSDEELGALQGFATAHGLNYPIWLASQEVMRAYQVHALPTNYFIDASGQVASSTVGMSSAWAVRARLRLAD
jgi:peroxiredoxin